MRTIGILLIIAGALALLASTVAFGDIGLSFVASGVIGILSGIGFLIASGPVNYAKRYARDLKATGSQPNISS